MKTLTLVRHAKSSWSTGERDIERPLNARGTRDAPLMGERLVARGIMPDLIISSPATRARTTAEIIARTIGYPLEQVVLDEQIYGVDLDGLEELVWTLDDRFDHIMLFGHNPTITDFVNQVTASSIGNVPTCGIAELRYDAERWATCHRAKLIDFDFPKNKAS